MPSEEAAPEAAHESPEYEFGPFRLDAARRALYRGADYVALTPKAAEMLVLLVEEAGRVVTREQIFERAWAGVVVEDGTIANNISALRKVLDPGFDGNGPIATVARRGYRFTAPVRASAASASHESPSPAAPGASTRITERDTVLLGDIENKTGEAVFDGTLRQALTLQLAQSPFLQILSDRKIRTALQQMERPMDTPAVGEVALEICQRTGARVAITGSIFAIGDEYSIGLTVLAGDTGDIVLSQPARARGKGEVLKALDAAASSLRAKLGESIASVNRLSARFDEVATASLEALRAYTIGRREWLERGDVAAIPHQTRATQLDPGFASAHSALAVAYMNLGQTLRANGHIRIAYELRERASERERRRIEATYHQIVTGNVQRALDAFIMGAGTYPRDAMMRGNGANMLMVAGQWEKAFEMAEAAMQMDPSNVVCSNLAIIQMALGRHEDARRTLEQAFARGIEAYFLRLDAYQEAFLRGDDEAMRRQFDAVAGREGEEDFLIAAQADTEAYFGRMERSRELALRAAASAARSGSDETSAVWLAQAAMREAECGFADQAIALASQALDRSEGRHVRCMAAYGLARSGNEVSVEELAGALDRDHPEDSVVQRYWLPSIRAARLLRAREWQGAVRALEVAESMELGLVIPFENGMVIPAYLRGLAYVQGGRREDAAREFAKIESRPGLLKNCVILPLAVKARAAALRGN